MTRCTAGLGEGFQPRGHVDAVAVNVRALDDDVPQVDADTKPDASLFGQIGLSLVHRLLDVNGTLDGLNDARKLGQEPVAHQLHDTSLALRDPRLHQLSTEGLQALERSRLILAHEAGIADNVGGKNGGKSAFQTLSPSPKRLTT